MTKKVNSRTKGNSTEVKLVNEFKNLGFNKAASSRSESKSMDDKGVDLVGLPFAVQSKKGYDVKAKFYRAVLDNMITKTVDDNFEYHIIIHSLTGVRGVKRKNVDDLVIMTKNDFYKLIKQ